MTLHPDIRRIETARTILRPHAPADFDAYAALWADPEVTRFIGGKPFTREAAWSRFLNRTGLWPLLGFGFFAVTDRETGAFLGEAGFHDMKRDLTPSIEGSLECGWGLSSAVAGKGLATEIVTALVGWAGEHFPGRRLTAMIEVGHVRSVRVAEKSGFTAFAETTYLGKPVTLFERRP
ncbi:GNAT family N-acetyltransferase [Prosthecomicrobium hirschii]|nr:GNAT family N-acetyltransferase [Prosthecomicrobium hirschii]TPQ49286.1 GNAT family N-acetyltransferase [Prosthecomicrobium hirschii]